MRNIPIELVAEILSDAQYDDCLPSYKWLRNYALVCRAWCPYAQALLFRRVVLLNGSKQCERLTATLSGRYGKDIEHTAFLGRCVRTLILGMDHQEVYIDAILLCPNLVELDVKLFHAMFRVDSLRRLKQAAKFEALHIRSTFYRPLHQLLEASPSIQYLSLDIRSTRAGSERIRPLWKLRELRILCLPSVAPDILSWILPTSESRNSLEVLHVNETAASQIVSSTTCPNLRSLHVRSISPADLTFFPKLEELALHTLRPSGAVLSALPHTVRHLLIPSVVKGIHDVLQGIAAYQVASNGALVTLTYTRTSTSGHAMGESDVRALQQLCTPYDIEFRFMDPPYGTIRGEVEPLGNIGHFPRPIPISSRRKVLSTIQMDTPSIVSPRKNAVRRLASYTRDRTAMIRRGMAQSISD
ncbi:unnamed protein product [Somion occarium]